MGGEDVGNVSILWIGASTEVLVQSVVRMIETVNRHRSGHDEKAKSAVETIELVGCVSEGRKRSQRRARWRDSAEKGKEW